MMMSKLIRAKYVITDPRLREKGLIEDGAIYIKDGVIVEVGKFKDLKNKYSDAEQLGSDNCIALPGFIDAHNHGQGLTTFSLGILDDCLEMFMPYWPGRVEKPINLVYLDALISAGRQIRSGVTTSMRHDARTLPSEAYKNETEAILKANWEAGLRFSYSIGITDKFGWIYGDNQKFVANLPAELRNEIVEVDSQESRKPVIDLDEWISIVTGLSERYRDVTTTKIVIGVMGPQWDSDKLLGIKRDIAQKLGAAMHGPFLETIYQQMYAEKEFGHSAVEHFSKLGILGPHHSSAHGIWLSEMDMEIFAQAQSTIIHCPSSNLRFYSGISPVPLLIEKGVNVALSVDSEGINDDDDTYQEMRLAMLLHRQPRKTGRALDEWDVLSMATVNGARAVALEDRIGTLEAGKEADIQLVSLERIFSDYIHPSIPPIKAFVYRAKTEDIDLVMVAGDVVYQNGKHTRFDFAQARKELNAVMGGVQWPPNPRKAKMVQKLVPYIQNFYDQWTPADLKPYHIMNSPFN